MRRIWGDVIPAVHSYTSGNIHFDSEDFHDGSVSMYEGMESGSRALKGELPDSVNRIININNSTNKICKVLDIGGRLGDQYIHLRNSGVDMDLVEYDVLEVPRLASRGDELYAKNNKVHFYFNSSDILGHSYDIIYSSCAYMYIPHWIDYTADLVDRFWPTIFFFDKTPMTTFNPTFVTEQITPQGRIPYRILNPNEIIGFFRAKGYFPTKVAPWFDTQLPDQEHLPNSPIPYYYFITTVERMT